MSSYRKYIMMGATTILLPLGKLLLKKILEKSTEDRDEDYYVDKGAELSRIRHS